MVDDDVEAFVQLRAAVREFGINLLDVMVFDQEFHWWSLRQLTEGSTEWVFER